MAKATSSRAGRARFLVSVLALSGFAALSGVACAQSTDMEGGAYWVMQRRAQRAESTPHLIQIKPRKARHRNFQPRHFKQIQRRHIIYAKPASPPAGGPPATMATAPAAAVVTPDFFVAVLGNGMAASLVDGLRQSFPDKPDIEFLPQIKPVSGLVRDDFYDWQAEAAKLLNGTQHLDAAIMLLGTDDHQPIRTASGYVRPDTPQWTQIYQARVKALMDLFAAKHVPLIWVGLPIVRSPRMAAAYLSFNDIYKAAAADSGATYVDLWDGFENDKGNYDAVGPDAQGNSAVLRKSDGIHFTRAGANKAAQFLQTSLDAIYQKDRPNGAAPDVASLPAPSKPAVPLATTSPVTAPLSGPPVADVLINPAPIPDISALIGHELAKPVLNTSIEARLQAALPRPQAAAVPKIPLGPASGPVVALQPAAFGNEALFGGKQGAPQRGAAAAQVFVDGMMVPQSQQGPTPATWPGGVAAQGTENP
ncbi:MAG: DUF459 domain-containing protein [Hyphomicrobiales bacterium]|nr:DUF459 domain-containing protein [Hyphomicrobiales bacterium]